MAGIVSWTWDFGDGETSALPNPNHVYAMPGEYVVTLTVFDNDGNTATTTEIVNVYDFDYRNGIPNASLTTKCYRLPARAGEGFGVSEYVDNEDAGMDWIWPPANIQIGKAYDSLKREIVLVLDSKTQREYRINDGDCWRDREDSYESKVIKSGIHQKSYSSVEGDHVPIRHIEHHLSFNSFDRFHFQGHEGYDDTGLPIGFRVKNQLFKDNEPFAAAVEAKNINIDADLVFQQKIEARTLQLRTEVLGAPYWLDSVVPYFETVDKSGVPSLKEMTEDGNQESMASMPLFHVSRNWDPLLNLATGAAATGSYAELITGPDGRAYSALRFGPADTGIRDTAAESISGDFTAYVWVKNATLAVVPKRIFATAAIIVEVVNDAGNLAVSIMDPVGGAIVDLSGNGTDWMLITVVRRGLAIRVYENKTLLEEMVVPVVSDYGAAVVFGDADIAIFDACVVPRAVDLEDIEYYYDDVLKGGEEVLQPF